MAVVATGQLWLDPVVALAVAANIVWTGSRIVFGSVAGLMDAALPVGEQRVLQGSCSVTSRRASTTTRCAPGSPARSGSSRCTCSCA